MGENDSGKTTILKALGMVLTGKINGGTLINRFNLDVRNEFKTAVANGEKPTPPTIEIEAYLFPPTEEEIFIKKFKGTNNSLHEDAVKKVSGIYEKIRKKQDADYISEFDKETEKYLNGK